MLILKTIEGALLIGMIVALVAIGLTVALRSGVVALGSPQGMRQVASNVSHTLMMLGACAFGLFLIQVMIGRPVGLSW